MRYSIVLVVLLCSCSYNELIPVCEPDQQIFSDLVKPIIESNCMGCHNESAGRPAILTTYDGVIDAVNNHGLENQIVNLQMPPGGGLKESDIETITNWISCE